MQGGDRRERLKQWLASGEARLSALSFPQRELWEASPVPVDSVANHICAVIHLGGEIPQPECLAAVQKVIDRQEVLRTSFLPGKEQPVQMIRREGQPAMYFRELTSAEADDESLKEFAEQSFATKFDLLQGPLYRIDTFRRSAKELVMAFSIHHAIADGWSLGVFIQELAAAYMLGKLAVPASEYPAPPATYAAWAAEERAAWTPELVEKRSEFWREQMRGASRLWAERPAGEGALAPRIRRVESLSSDLTRAAKELARKTGATLFNVLLAAFRIALCRHTGIGDITVGTPVASRQKKNYHETMGYFAGIVPLRGLVDPDRTFLDSVATTNSATIECFAHAMPFAELARSLSEDAHSDRNPIFDVRFALQNHPMPDISVRGLSLKLRMRSTGTARFDLACELTEMGDALEVVWLHRPDKFNNEEMAELHRLFRVTLASVCRSPGDRVAAHLRTDVTIDE